MRSPVSVGALLTTCLAVLAGTAGATPRADVQFEIDVTGKGTVVSAWDAQKRRVECRGLCPRSSTVTTFDVDAGIVVLRAWAARDWVFTGWSRACRGSVPRCVLRIQRPARVKATFVPRS